MSEDSAVLLFVKAPEKGGVKSRLAEALGEELALEAYKHFASDVIKIIQRGNYPLRIFCYPPDSGESVKRWLGNGFVCFPQTGRDLGKRMENAFDHSFLDGLEKVLIVGSDLPDLKGEVIAEAFKALDRSDAVIGPASDGGYYLIGFRKDSFLPEIFHGIEWSSGSVFTKTMKVFKEFGSRVHMLPEWHDVDTIEDLRSLIARDRDADFRNSQTMSWVMHNKNKIFPGIDHGA